MIFYYLGIIIYFQWLIQNFIWRKISTAVVAVLAMA
jgi:hypothetical protein